MSWEQVDGNDPAGVVWWEVLHHIFSRLGRLRVLAECRRPASAGYCHPTVTPLLGAGEADRALRAAHEQVWSDWVGGSLEQQQADLAVYLCDFHEDIDALLEAWRDTRPLLRFIPDAASAEERTLFTHNLQILVALLRNQYCLQRPRIFPAGENALMEQMLTALREEYGQPGLTLGKLAQKLGRTKGHLGRVFKQCTRDSFHDYLREFRMDKAVALLSESTHDVKAVAGMIGYSDASYFIREFRELIGCTPVEFRVKCGRLKGRAFILPLARAARASTGMH